MSRTSKSPRRPAPRKKAAPARGVTEALRVSRALLQSVVTGAPIILWAIEREGIITLSVGKALLTLGFTPGEVVGRSVYEMYADNPGIVSSIKQVLATGEEMQMHTEVGATAFDTRLSPRFDRRRKLTGLIGVSMDVTERRKMEEAVRGLSRRLWSIHEEERRRIARDLHDEAGQAMTALKLQLDLARRESDPARMRDRLRDASALATDVLDELRRISHELRTGALEELGLLPALRSLAEEFRRRAKFEIAFDVPLRECPRCEPDCEAAVFRFVQEALTNVHRHAGAKKVVVTFEYDGSRVSIHIVDDGCGFDTGRPPELGKIGLLAMQERAKILGGGVQIESRAGHGTRLRLELPLTPLVA